jgi:PhnB protein
MAQLNPYINFNGNCRTALSFYKECFGGELTLQAVGETPAATQCPAGTHDQIMHAMLLANGVVIMGSDMTGPDGLTPGNNILLTLNCNSEEEINSLFNKLSEDGKVLQPLKTEFWGGIFGYLKDKFGIGWMFNYQKANN